MKGLLALEVILQYLYGNYTKIVALRLFFNEILNFPFYLVGYLLGARGGVPAHGRQQTLIAVLLAVFVHGLVDPIRVKEHEVVGLERELLLFLPLAEPGGVQNAQRETLGFVKMAAFPSVL